MRKITLADRARYWFDNTMSQGAVALIGWLFLASGAFITLTAATLALFGLAPTTESGEQEGFASSMWRALLHAIDTGTVTSETGSRTYLAIMFATTLGGIFVVSVLIGLLTSGIQDKLTELRKGRSFVVEEGHTLILGWSPQVYTIVSELVIANESLRRAAIVVLAERDKVEMDDALRQHVGDTKSTRVVCRTGSPIDLDHLAIVNPEGARSIVVLSPEGPDPDAHVIKVLLALLNGRHRLPEGCHIVAEIRDRRNLEPVELVGQGRVEVVLVEDLISRITVQTCRQSGLSVVYGELLDFAGDELYLAPAPELAGKTFAEAMFCFEHCALLGLKRDGEVELGPDFDLVLRDDDELIVVAEDDSTVRVDVQAPRFDEAKLRRSTRLPAPPEKTLILGYNRRAELMLEQLDAYVAEGSEALVIADVDRLDERLGGVALERLSLSWRRGDTTSRALLDGLELGRYDHVITLSYAEDLDLQRADARTLVTLLHLRDIAQKTGASFSVVSEILDLKNRELAEVTKADDFIVSDRLVSLVLAQIAEARDRAAVFRDLFDADGKEIYLRPVTEYVETGGEVDFYTVLEGARRRGEVALGYRLARHASDPERAYGVRVNPKKSEHLSFADGDRIIVLAED